MGDPVRKNTAERSDLVEVNVEGVLRCAMKCWSNAQWLEETSIIGYGTGLRSVIGNALILDLSGGDPPVDSLDNATAWIERQAQEYQIICLYGNPDSLVDSYFASKNAVRREFVELSMPLIRTDDWEVEIGTIRAVVSDSDERLAQWREVFRARRNLDASVADFVSMQEVGHDGLHALPVRRILVYENDVPIGGALLYWESGVAGIYNMTLPEGESSTSVRRVLTQSCMAEACRASCRFITTLCHIESVSLYAADGFEECGRLVDFICKLS